MGLVLVVAILFLTMGWRSALTVGLAIPATALLTLGRIVEIHQMSIIGIIVALGLMVDNAIVMTNALRERYFRGFSAAATRMRCAIWRYRCSPVRSRPFWRLCPLC